MSLRNFVPDLELHLLCGKLARSARYAPERQVSCATKITGSGHNVAQLLDFDQYTVFNTIMEDTNFRLNVNGGALFD